MEKENYYITIGFSNIAISLATFAKVVVTQQENYICINDAIKNQYRVGCMDIIT